MPGQKNINLEAERRQGRTRENADKSFVLLTVGLRVRVDEGYGSPLNLTQFGDLLLV